MSLLLARQTPVTTPPLTWLPRMADVIAPVAVVYSALAAPLAAAVPVPASQPAVFIAAPASAPATSLVRPLAPAEVSTFRPRLVDRIEPVPWTEGLYARPPRILVPLNWQPDYPATIDRTPWVEGGFAEPARILVPLNWQPDFPATIDRTPWVEGAYARPPAILAPTNWQPDFPATIDRTPSTPSDYAHPNRIIVATTPLNWQPDFPATIDRTPWVEGALAAPSRIIVAATPLTWQPAFPAAIDRTPWVEGSFAEPARILVALNWQPSYPATIDRTPWVEGGFAEPARILVALNWQPDFPATIDRTPWVEGGYARPPRILVPLNWQPDFPATIDRTPWVEGGFAEPARILVALNWQPDFPATIDRTPWVEGGYVRPPAIVVPFPRPAFPDPVWPALITPTGDYRMVPTSTTPWVPIAGSELVVATPTIYAPSPAPLLVVTSAPVRLILPVYPDVIYGLAVIATAPAMPLIVIVPPPPPPPRPTPTFTGGGGGGGGGYYVTRFSDYVIDDDGNVLLDEPAPTRDDDDVRELEHAERAVLPAAMGDAPMSVPTFVIDLLGPGALSFGTTKRITTFATGKWGKKGGAAAAVGSAVATFLATKKAGKVRLPLVAGSSIASLETLYHLYVSESKRTTPPTRASMTAFRAAVASQHAPVSAQARQVLMRGKSGRSYPVLVVQYTADIYGGTWFAQEARKMAADGSVDLRGTLLDELTPKSE